jgi:hypothetical protein
VKGRKESEAEGKEQWVGRRATEGGLREERWVREGGLTEGGGLMWPQNAAAAATWAAHEGWLLRAARAGSSSESTGRGSWPPALATTRSAQST